MSATFVLYIEVIGMLTWKFWSEMVYFEAYHLLLAITLSCYAAASPSIRVRMRSYQRLSHIEMILMLVRDQTNSRACIYPSQLDPVSHAVVSAALVYHRHACTSEMPTNPNETIPRTSLDRI